MTAPAPDPAARPWLPALAVAGTLLVGAVAWLTASRLAPRDSGTGAAPVIPHNQLLTLAAPVPAPAIDLPGLGEDRFSSVGAAGKVLIVNFWATWCEPCAQELPTLAALAAEMERGHPGKLRVVAVSVDEEPGAVARFLAAPGLAGFRDRVAVALDPGVGPVTREFHCRGRGACRPEDVRLPETYVVDPSGRIVAIVVGYLDWSTPGAWQYVEALLPR